MTAKHLSKRGDSSSGKASATENQSTAASPTNYWTNRHEEKHEAQSGLAQQGATPGREAEGAEARQQERLKGPCVVLVIE